MIIPNYTCVKFFSLFYTVIAYIPSKYKYTKADDKKCTVISFTSCCHYVIYLIMIYALVSDGAY